MMMRTGLAAVFVSLMLLPGCGRADNTPGQPSADQRKKLDDIARKRDEEQGTFDTSPDSLVPAEAGAGAGNNAEPANLQAPANASGNAAR